MVLFFLTLFSVSFDYMVLSDVAEESFFGMPEYDIFILPLIATYFKTWMFYEEDSIWLIYDDIEIREFLYYIFVGFNFIASFLGYGASMYLAVMLIIKTVSFQLTGVDEDQVAQYLLVYSNAFLMTIQIVLEITYQVLAFIILDQQEHYFIGHQAAWDPTIWKSGDN